MVSQKPQSEYRYSSPVTIRARMHNTGQVRTGQLVQVTNLTSGACYDVILEDDGRARCSCPHYTKRLAGTLKTCKHIAGARGEAAPQPAPDAPALPIAACSCCGTLLPADEAIATVKRRNGTPGGYVCRDAAGCLARRNGPDPSETPAAAAFAARRAQALADRALWD